ncbi:MAG: BREX-2 system adenine-specific DNA-methyltransferase PglX [Pirellulaceae bacterium]
MINRQRLLNDLQELLRSLEADLLERSESADVPEVVAALKEEYEKAKKAERTALNYEDWRSDYITQIAAAWVLSCVFVRFLEDNRLVDPPKISGPTGSGQSSGNTDNWQLATGNSRLDRARDEHTMFFQDRERATQTDREYLLDVFGELAKLPGAKEIFGQHNPVWQLPNWLSGDAAGELLRYFQRIDADTGTLVHDFSDPEWDTRFLGDLYQDLSQAARKKYALLQTPEFVEEFILDRTLDPALDEFGLEGFKMIDPACGSGHFLLGAFPRIFDRWCREDPGAKCRVVAQRTLDSIYGVDLNPFAVAIARFRLLLEALKACGVLRLSKAPAFELNLACGDSLYHGREAQQTLPGVETDESHYFHTEDASALRRMLREGTYHCVVANPPYITPKDRAANNAYRRLYTSCHMKYSLSVPFMERIFRLAVESCQSSVVSGQLLGTDDCQLTTDNFRPAGFVGQITANSFMKREFGKKLIEKFLPTVDLTHVIDTSGAYIPGHGTPTVILLGRNRGGIGDTIRTVMGIRGEPSTPDDAAKGLVWTAIVEQIDHAGSQSDFVSVGDSSRELFSKHPWSIGGGGAAELKDKLDESAKTALSKLCDSIGITSFTLEDDIYILPDAAARRSRLRLGDFRIMVVGDAIRDWNRFQCEVAVFPYDVDFCPVPEEPQSPSQRYLWMARTCLANNKMFGGKTKIDCGLKWYEYGRLTAEKLRRRCRSSTARWPRTTTSCSTAAGGV